MCGILGFAYGPWDEADAQAALHAIDRRGPDARAVRRVDDAVVFGHARLAIIDVEGGGQPMSGDDGRHWIVFNGEIYNFAALRAELEREGLRFATRSDTEVLLAGHAAWGARLPERLDGMFAYAIWDRVERTLSCARDHVGVKPFFYAAGAAAGGGFAFASTLAPFMRLPGFPRRLDAQALRDYLAFQTPLAPRSMLADVAQLPPAHRLTWRPGEAPRLDRYWFPSRADPARAMDREALIEAADAAIAESVRRQLVSDVPLGAFLSGGIDSSLVVHYMARAGARPIRTFTVRFADASLDESRIAREVAQAFGTEHHEFDAEALDGPTWLSLVGSLDQPLADAAFVPTAALARLTRQHVTVALSGDGGDELFGGYERFLDDEAAHPPRAWQPAAAALVRAGLLPASLTRRTLSGRALLAYRRTELGDWPGTRKDLRAWLSPELAAAARPHATLERWHGLIDDLGGVADRDALMRADLWTYLSENCLVKTDRATMHASLEARVPLLGRPVLDLVLSQPAALHFDPGTKAVLRALARRHLPEAVWNRRKQGFAVPLERWFAGAWREAGDHLVARAPRLAPWLDAPRLAALWRDARAGRASRTLAYTFLVLLAWLERNAIDA